MPLSSFGLWAGVLAVAVASAVCVLPLALPRLAELWKLGGVRTRLRLGAGFAVLGVLSLAAWALATAAESQARALALGLGTTALAAQPAALSTRQRALLGTGPWLNTSPLRAQDLRGKVVLVNFWTYSCINSLRALPYLRAWDAKYRDRGLIVVGVHTPEFKFETDLANVRRATAALGVNYPVVLDSDYAIWRAFDNRAWPALYFMGADGHVRRQVLGEGDYDRSEKLIQKLLAQRNGVEVSDAITAVQGSGSQAPPDEADSGSGETYVGYGQASGFSSPGGIRRDAAAIYRGEPKLALNKWSLAGDWTVGREFATSESPSALISYRFHARDLHLVVAPSRAGRAVRFRVTIDSQPPGKDHGVDVGPDGAGVMGEARMYQLVRQGRPVMDRTFEIEFLDAGVRAYVFTFG